MGKVGGGGHILKSLPVLVQMQSYICSFKVERSKQKKIRFNTMVLDQSQ